MEHQSNFNSINANTNFDENGWGVDDSFQEAGTIHSSSEHKVVEILNLSIRFLYAFPCICMYLHFLSLFYFFILWDLVFLGLKSSIFFLMSVFLGARKNGVLLLYQGLKQMILHLTVRSGWVICLFYFCKSL